MSTKRAWKLCEFTAHAGTVNCVALGQKSSRVIVSGGEDRKVNMWAVGKTNCILSLAGHTSPVESVRFGVNEDLVAAGSLSGALKIWNLDEVKILRTFTGHKASMKCIDFHPFGDYVATGSLDTNIKLWDMRKKGCIYTYKGHASSVNCMRFSPDGRWIASGGEDGIVKLWDLTIGKMLAEFRGHTAPVSTVAFHPNEFLLATGSADRTVKFWDLESMQMVASTDGDAMPVRSVVFSPSASCLYCAAENQLRVYGWEPSCCYETVTTSWGRVSDLALDQQHQLIGVSCIQSEISAYVVDVQRIQPLGGVPCTAPAANVRPPTTSSTRRSFISVDRNLPMTQQQLSNCVSPKEEQDDTTPTDEQSDDLTTIAEVSDPENYREVFHPKKQLPHSPQLKAKPFVAPPEDGEPASLSSQSVTSSKRAPISNAVESQSSELQAAVISSSSSSSNTSQVRPFTSTGRDTRTKKVVSKSVRSENAVDIRPHKSAVHSDSSTCRTEKDIQSISGKSSMSATARDDFTVDIRVGNRHSKNDIPHLNEELRGLSLNDAGWKESIVPARIDPDQIIQKSKSSNQEVVTDDTAASLIHSGHQVLMSVLMSRRRNLEVVKAMWSTGNVKTAIESALSMNDQAVIYDVVNLMLNKTALWNLDLCALLIPALAGLTASKYDNYIRTGFDALKHILRQYSSIIKANITAPPSIGVDISREERYSKCMSCYKLLMNIRSDMERQSSLGLNSEAACHYRELRLLLSQLD